MLVAILPPAAACRTRDEPPSAPDPSALYQRLQDEARQEVQAWVARQNAPPKARPEGAPGGDPDPRPRWAARLEEFAVQHPGTDPAAEALAGVIGLYGSLRDYQGFERAFKRMLAVTPDAPQLQAVLAQIAVMRMEEAGGPGILQAADLETKGRVYRQAAPRIAADLEKVLEATRNAQTKAATHYALAGTWYQFELDPAKALAHYAIVVKEYPDWSHADSAALRVRELETLGVGRPAPDFTATAIDGRKVRLSSLKGQVVLIDFWATWCQPCLDELPGLRRAYDRLKRRGFTIVGVNVDADVDTVRQFLAIHRLEWPMIATGAALEDPIARLYAIQQLPMSYLVDRQGVIRGRTLFGTQVEQAADALLRR